MNNRFLEINGVYETPKPKPKPKLSNHFLEINGVYAPSPPPPPPPAPAPKPAPTLSARFYEINGAPNPARETAQTAALNQTLSGLSNTVSGTPSILSADHPAQKPVGSGTTYASIELPNGQTLAQVIAQEQDGPPPSVEARIAELEANLEFLDSLPRPRGGHAGRIAGEEAKARREALEAELEQLQNGHLDGPANANTAAQANALAEVEARLEARLAQLEGQPRRGGHGGRNAANRRAEEIEAIKADLERIANGQRPLLIDTVFSNEESRAFHAEAAGIDVSLLDTTITHEGGNFHSAWRGPVWPTIQELINDLNDIGSPIADTSVGYAQIQQRNAIEIGEDTFGLNLANEEARELLTHNDEFSNAIAAEFLAERAQLIDPEHRSNRVVFTSYAASPKTIELFNSIDWDFSRAAELVESGDLERSTFNDLRDRYFDHYPNAAP